MFVSKFDSLYNTLPQSESLSWSDFVSRYSQHFITAKKEAAPLISPAEWPEGAERKKEAVLRVHFAALDLDGVSEDVVLQLRQTLASYQFLMATSWSHPKAFAESGLWYLRVFLPLSRPVEAAEWTTFWPRLNTFFGNVLDANCSDLGRVYYVPSAPEASPYNQIVTGHGQVLDVDAILRLTPVETNEPSVVSREALLAYAKTLRSKVSPHLQQMGDVLAKVLRGDVFAEPGERDSTLFRLTGFLADKWPKANPALLASHFQNSLKKMSAVSGDAPSLDDVIIKLVRHQERCESEQAQEQESLRSIMKRRIRNATGGTRDTPYTDEELQQFADDNCVSREDFTNRWIIQHGISFYIFKLGRYGKPVGFRELLNAAYKDLSLAYSSGVDVFRVTPKGVRVKKTIEELVEEYGTVIASAKASFTLQKSSYHWATETFEEAVCPLRPLKPEFSEIVDQYFKLLGGANHRKLLDWVSVVTQLDKPCAALFLEGVSSSGKTLLADGLTRLWSDGEPTELGLVLGGAFNEAIANCPLVLADEQLPSFIKKEGSTAELRSFIQARNRTLTRKYRTPITLHGSIRLIVTGNNLNVFHTGESLSNNDIEAFKGRLLHLTIDEKGRDYLNTLSESDHNSLVLGDAIAKHALWLRDNHEIQDKDRRFLVAGTDTALHHSLMTGTGIRSDICCWLISYLQNPNKLHQDKEGLIRVFQGDLLVHVRALILFWKTYPTNINPPAASQISTTLSDLSDGRKQLKDATGRLTQYRKIRPELLLAWNEEHGFAIRSEIINALAHGEKETQHA